MKKKLKNVIFGVVTAVSFASVGVGAYAVVDCVNKSNANAIEQTQEQDPTEVPLQFHVFRNKLFGYNGTTMPTELTIPTSYSLSKPQLETVVCNRDDEFEEFRIEFERQFSIGSSDHNDDDELFELTLVDANGNSVVCKTVSDLWQYQMLHNPVLPITAKFYKQTAIEGNDIQITSIYGFECRNGADKSNLKKVVIPASISLIDVNVFPYCTEIEEFVVESANKTFKSVDGAIVKRDDGSLIAFPQGKTGDYVLNDEIKSVQNATFCNSKLNSLTLNSNIQSIGGIFQQTNIQRVDLSNTQITEMNMPFYSAKTSEIVLNEGITRIGPYSFQNCVNLTNIVLPNTLVDLGPYAFAGCPLIRLTIPENVAKLGCGVVEKTTQLTLLPTTPPELYNGYGTATNVFAEAIDNNIIIPAGTLLAYQSATGWSQYADKFVEATTSFEEYVVVFDANGGTGTMSNAMVTKSSPTNLFPEAIFTRDGWTFAGWATAPTGYTTVYNPGVGIGDDFWIGKTEEFTLYAIWGKMITFNHCGGTNELDTTGFVEGEDLTNVYVPTPTKSGYTFAGYYTQENGQGTKCIDSNGKVLFDLSDDLNIQTDMILFAYWKTSSSGGVTY